MKDHAYPSWRSRAIAILLGLLCVAPLPACSTNPATGERQLNAMSTEQEIQLGSEAAPEFLASYGGPIPSPQYLAYVRQIGTQLAAVSERPELPWEFHVVDSAVINAFALPGGKVFISRALLAKMTNEAQLAGVLGHEIGHVTAQHIGQQMTRATGIQVAAAVIGAAAQTSDQRILQALGVGAQLGGSVYLLSFGRGQEVQADLLGLRYMSKLGYDPEGQIEVMRILKAASSGSMPIEFLSTHPYPETRIANLQEEIRNNYSQAGTARYAKHPERFQSTVLAALRTLPPPKHTGEEPAPQ